RYRTVILHLLTATPPPPPPPLSLHDALPIYPAARVVLLGLYDPYRTRFLDEQVALWDSRLIARFARDPAVDVVRIADLLAYTARSEEHTSELQSPDQLVCRLLLETKHTSVAE